MSQKYVIFADVAIGFPFAWHGHPYVKASESTANPVEKDNKVSMYQAQVGPRERVAITEKTDRLMALHAERAELDQAYRTAREPMNDTGSYGQVSMRDVAEAENAEMILKHWDDEHGAELAHLIAVHGKHLGPQILDQRI